MVSLENRVILAGGALGFGWAVAFSLLGDAGLAPAWLVDAAMPLALVALIALPQVYLARRGHEPVTTRRGLAAFVTAVAVTASVSSGVGSDAALLAGGGFYVAYLAYEGYLGYRGALREAVVPRRGK